MGFTFQKFLSAFGDVRYDCKRLNLTAIQQITGKSATQSLHTSTAKDKKPPTLIA